MKQFIKQIFSDDDGQGSMSRVAMFLHGLTVCGCVIFLVVKNHAFPEPLAMAAMTAFATAPYAINRFQKDKV